MSDIDFDELDRAVTGALGSDTSDEVSFSEATLESPVETPAEAPALEKVERTTMNPVAPAPKPAAASNPAARRSSGRFMDMVHPSSDMKGRSGAGPVKNTLPATPVAPVSQTDEFPSKEAPAAWSEPLDSPFLPDAKVEKRPLGGGDVATEATVTSANFDFQGMLDEPKEELLEAPEPQERIEATSLPNPIDFAAAKAVTEEVEKLPEDEEVSKVEVSAQPEVAPESPQVVEEPVGPTSITPQYKEQPSSNQESGAIYDTESYHQAVVQPVKKKSGWLTVMWIVLLVILGAGAGWAIYTYILPTL